MKSALLALAALATLTGPALAAKKPTTPPAPALGQPTDADWRTPDAQNILVVDTTRGQIIVEMTPEAAPDTVARIRDLTRAGIYNGRTFFRVLDGFMDQTGDPQDNGAGQSDRPNLYAEFTFRRGTASPFVSVAKTGGAEIGFIGAFPVISQTLDLAVLTVDHKVTAFGAYCPGVMGMARADDPGSGNSQFFFMRDTTHSLEKNYTAWGRAISGLDVIRSIKVGAPPNGSVDQPQDHMLTARILADIPAAERPTIRVIDPKGAWYQAYVAQVKAQKVIDFSVCDLEVQAKVTYPPKP